MDDFLPHCSLYHIFLGIALSEAEASVAAPFTSKVFDISCVPCLVREGRAALVTSFSIFKYIALYSFIQFFGVLILYYGKSSYNDWSFFTADLILAFAFALAITQSRTSGRLAQRCPPGRLSDPKTIVNIFLKLLVMLCFQIVGFIVSRVDNELYQPPENLGELDFGSYHVSYESYAIDWLTSKYNMFEKCFQLLGMKKENPSYKIIFEQLLENNWVETSLDTASSN